LKKKLQIWPQKSQTGNTARHLWAKSIPIAAVLDWGCEKKLLEVRTSLCELLW